MSLRVLFFVTLLTAALSSRADIYGRSEHVVIVGAARIEVVARLDSGADGSALHAVNVKYFSRDGNTWVRFTIDNGSVLAGSRVTLERPVLKDVKIRQKGGGIEHRPLVEVDLCIGDRQFRSKLNLSDRSGYTAPLLIGANELAQLGSVDVARQFTHEPSCEAPDVAQTLAANRPKAGSQSSASVVSTSLRSGTTTAFRCDGRTRCPQMRSCEEAEYFLDNCPNTAMDGDRDGVPCEEQWCR